MKIKEIHIGSVIEQKFKESQLSIPQLAQLIHCDRTTVYDIFKRKSIDVDRLLAISEALKYNFLWEVYLKDNPLMFLSAASCLKVGFGKKETGTPEFLNICLEIDR